jgi:hypothetical protein
MLLALYVNKTKFSENLIFNPARSKAETTSQALSCQLPGFKPRSVHVGILVDRVVLRNIFSKYFRFPCQFTFSRLLRSSLPVIQGWYWRPSGQHTKQAVSNHCIQIGIRTCSNVPSQFFALIWSSYYRENIR